MGPNRQRSRGPSRDHQMREESPYDERVVFVNRVARVVRGGRRFRFQALVILGDHKGQVGVGISKGADVSAAVTKATEVAKKHLIKFPIRNGTLVHDVEAKTSGSKILILPAAPGTGLIAGGVVRTILEVAGYENALSKAHGSSNRLNMAYATLEALKTMTSRSEWIAKEQPEAKSSGPRAKKAASKKLSARDSKLTATAEGRL